MCRLRSIRRRVSAIRPRRFTCESSGARAQRAGIVLQVYAQQRQTPARNCVDGRTCMHARMHPRARRHLARMDAMFFGHAHSRACERIHARTRMRVCMNNATTRTSVAMQVHTTHTGNGYLSIRWLVTCLHFCLRCYFFGCFPTFSVVYLSLA
jgi:hypothetical protein